MNYLSNNKRIFIKNLFIIYLISFFTIPLFTNDGDTGFRKKRFYLEATYGLSYGLNGSMVGFMNDNNKLKIPAFVEPDDYLVYSFTQTPANRPSLRSTSNNLLFEYGLSDKWGLGFTVHREMYDVKNYSTSNYAENYFLTSLLFGNNMNGQEAIIAASLNKRYAGIKENIQILGIGTIDINLAYHFFSNRKFDPYIRFGL